MVESTAAMARAVTRVVLWRSLIDVMESVTLRAELGSQEVVDRVLGRHPPLERHATKRIALAVSFSARRLQTHPRRIQEWVEGL